MISLSAFPKRAYSSWVFVTVSIGAPSPRALLREARLIALQTTLGKTCLSLTPSTDLKHRSPDTLTPFTPQQLHPSRPCRDVAEPPLSSPSRSRPGILTPLHAEQAV